MRIVRIKINFMIHCCVFNQDIDHTLRQGSDFSSMAVPKLAAS